MKNLKIVLASAFLVLTLSSCSLLYPNLGKPTTSPKPTDTKTQSPTPDPTDSKTPTPDPSKGSASVDIMDAYVDGPNGILQVIAQVTNFSEDGGNCTLTFNGGGKTATITVLAESNAANTQCRSMELALGTLPKGTGIVTVTYDSEKKHGISSATSVVIP